MPSNPNPNCSHPCHPVRISDVAPVSTQFCLRAHLGTRRLTLLNTQTPRYKPSNIITPKTQPHTLDTIDRGQVSNATSSRRHLLANAYTIEMFLADISEAGNATTVDDAIAALYAAGHNATISEEVALTLLAAVDGIDNATLATLTVEATAGV